jgi:hypothetical protein
MGADSPAPDIFVTQVSDISAFQNQNMVLRNALNYIPPLSSVPTFQPPCFLLGESSLIAEFVVLYSC